MSTHQVRNPTESASGAQLWRLNELGLIQKALELSAGEGKLRPPGGRIKRPDHREGRRERPAHRGEVRRGCGNDGPPLSPSAVHGPLAGGKGPGLLPGPGRKVELYLAAATDEGIVILYFDPSELASPERAVADLRTAVERDYSRRAGR